MPEGIKKLVIQEEQLYLQTSGRIPSAKMLSLLQEQADIALELKARSEAMATSQPGNHSHQRFLIGLISCLLPIPDLMHPVFEKILLGVRGRLTANDCDLLLCATRPLGADDTLRQAAAEQTINRGVDALIAWGIGSGDPECVPILNSNLPVIFVDNDVLGSHAGSVMSSNVDSMREVVNHLYQTGRRRIAHISGHFETRPGPDRVFGYRSEMSKLGLEIPEGYVQEGDFFHESGLVAMSNLLKLPVVPDAVACASDAMAIAAITVIEAAGLRVPEDIAVTGFDDSEFAATVIPSLTTIRQDALGMGTAAGEAILRMLEDPNSPPPVAVIDTELIIRESSAPAATD